MTIAVVYDRADAAALLAQRRAFDAVLALTPNARSALKGKGLKLLDPRSRYTDCKQARTVARVSAARRRMLTALGTLGPVEREIVVDQLNRAAYGACRLWYTMGAEGPWLVPSGSDFRVCADRKAAFEALLSHVLGPYLAELRHAARLEAPPLAALYRLLRRVALRPSRRATARFVTGVLKSQFGLHESLERQHVPVCTIVASPARAGWKEYLKLGREMLRGLVGHRRLQVALICKPDGRGIALADRAVASLGDPVIEAALGHCRGHLAARLGHVASAVDDAQHLLNELKPTAFVASELSDLGSQALAASCGEASVKRLVLSRNAHTPPEGGLAWDSTAGYFFARYPEGLVDEYLMWSPNGAAAARAILPEARWPQIRAVRALPPATSARSGAADRLILMADSFAGWRLPHNWVSLTSDEYIEAARALCGAVACFEDCRLLIRAKAKLECDLAALEALVEPPGNCSIKIRDVPFHEDLAKADLLVSFHSTTIEEALHARVPVLLWGGAKRYRYMPARETPPTWDDRAAIYRVTVASQLQSMLQAILDAHAGTPLDDAEIEPFVWPASVPDIDALARDLAGPRMRRSYTVEEMSCDAG